MPDAGRRPGGIAPTRTPGHGFLSGGGSMGALMRGFDWAATPLGPPEAWPQTLRTCIRMMLNTRHPVMVLWGPDLLQFYNDDYARSLGPESHPAMLGRPCRDWWPDVWHLIGPQFEHVMAGRGATWHEDMLVPVRRNGRQEDTWWTYSYSPIDDDSRPDGVGGVLVLCKDVTAEHLASETLREKEARWRSLFENMHEGLGLCEIVRGPDGAPVDYRHLEVNPAAARLTGLPPERLVGQLASEAIPGLERHWLDIFARVAETGEPAHAIHEAAPLGQWYEVLAYRTGPDRFAVLFLNVTARRAAEERQTLLTREVDHRAKNVLAVVQAAVQLTHADSLEEYRRTLAGRVSALARTQSLLAAEQWRGADLRSLVEAGVLPFDGDGRRLVLDGPPVALPATAVQPLAMALHELATNAVKHGALSVAEGRVALRWRLEGGLTSPALRLRWEESGGPPVPPAPARHGFGSRVLDATLRRQLGGEIMLDWRLEGLACVMLVPLLRPAGMAANAVSRGADPGPGRGAAPAM